MRLNSLDHQRDRLLALAYTLAPELYARPLYLVHGTELGVTPTLKGCMGLVGQTTDLACRDAIGHRWRGRGWCIILAEIDDTEGPLLHELAHILCGQLPWKEQLTLPEQFVAAYVRAAIHEDLVDAKPIEESVHDRQHGIAFHRALLHLWHRSEHLDLLIIGLQELMGCRQPGMSDLARSIREEASQCRFLSFAEIMARPMPRRFRNVWNRRQGSRQKGNPYVVSQ